MLLISLVIKFGCLCSVHIYETVNDCMFAVKDVGATYASNGFRQMLIAIIFICKEDTHFSEILAMVFDYDVIWIHCERLNFM